VKIRVLQVIATLKRAGAERVAVALARGLDPALFETEVVSLYDAFPGGFEDELEEAGVNVRHLGKRRGFDARIYRRLAAVVREFRPAIVQTHSYVLRYALPACRLAAGVKPRMVHTVHNEAEREVEWVGRLLHRAAFRMGVVPVAVSALVAESFKKVYGFKPQTIPNGVETGGLWRPGERDAWRAAHGFGASDGLVVSVARLDPQKNPLALIERFAAALGPNPRWHLLLAGEGSLRQTAEARASALGLAERVRFLGMTRDIAGLLSACDIFALASEWEGSPVSIVEAMAAGLPVVATAVGGVPELVDERSGRLVTRSRDA
jgi:glycosyltransferase involved in cell wall biosynthesis